MLCAKCGKEIPEDAILCPECGEQVNTETENNQEVQEDTMVSKKPNKSLKFIIAGAVALVAILLVVFNLSSLEGFFVKAFASDATYFKYVEKKAFENYTSDVSSVYGTYMEAMGTTDGSKGALEINVGDDALKLLEDSLEGIYGKKLEMDWLNTIAFKVAGNVDDKVQQMDFALAIDDKEILDMDMIMDMDKQKMFFAILNLSEQYVGVSMDEYTEEDVDVFEFYANEEIMEALPSEKEFNNLLNKYIKIVIDNMDNVEKSKDTIEVDGVEQKVTVLVFHLDSQTIYEIGEDILNEAKKDKELKKYIEDVAKAAGEEDTKKVYEDFVASVDEALKTIQEEEYDNETLLVLTDYVNANHEVVGRRLEVEDEEVFRYVTAQKGKKFATELECYGVTLTGKGTDSGKELNGEYAITYEGSDIGNITIEDYETDKVKEGYLNGTFSFVPSSDLLKLMGLDTVSIATISVAKPEIQLVCESSKKSAKMELNVNNDGKLFAGITVDSEIAKSSKIKVPTEDKIVDVENIDIWAESLELDKITAALRETSIPTELIDLLESYMQMGMDTGSDMYDEDLYSEDYMM